MSFKLVMWTHCTSSSTQNLMWLWNTFTFHNTFPLEASAATTYWSLPSPSAEYRTPPEMTGETGFGCIRFATADAARKASATHVMTNFRWNTLIVHSLLRLVYDNPEPDRVLPQEWALSLSTPDPSPRW